MNTSSSSSASLRSTETNHSAQTSDGVSERLIQDATSDAWQDFARVAVRMEEQEGEDLLCLYLYSRIESGVQDLVDQTSADISLMIADSIAQKYLDGIDGMLKALDPSKLPFSMIQVILHATRHAPFKNRQELIDRCVQSFEHSPYLQAAVYLLER